MDAAGRPGGIVLFGSAETTALGVEALRWLRERRDVPGLVAVLETPAGFEPNAEDVAARWTDFLRRQSDTHGAEFVQLPTRRRGTQFSPDDPELVAPMLAADLLVLGAGSPSYTVRQLHSTLAWRYAQATHLLGASFFLASAAAVAAGSFALPVYEIYKVGEDLHWKDGLGLFDLYGLRLAVVTHWDNTDGGASLDTSLCYMGEARFAELRALLPADVVVVGIAEHTALALDPASATAQVLGQRNVTIQRGGKSESFASGAAFPLTALGPFALPDAKTAVSRDLAAAIQEARRRREHPRPPADVAALVASREQARSKQDWAMADRLRDEITERGWQIDDTPDGPRVQPHRDEAAAETARG